MKKKDNEENKKEKEKGQYDSKKLQIGRELGSVPQNQDHTSY